LTGNTVSTAICPGVASVALHYREAAGDYRRAADAIATFDKHEQWRLEIERGQRLTAQGSEFGDNVALAEAINVYTQALALVPRADAPLDWARTQGEFATAELTLGRRETGPERLNSALAHFRLAAEELTLARAPGEWAQCQDGVGSALDELGGRQSDPAGLEKAVAVYRTALAALPRERAPEGWAELQIGLGTALS
jgi:hypothetical protein